MSTIDGRIQLKLKLCTLQTTDVNISKAQPSKAKGLGGVVFLNNKMPATL